MRGCVREVRFLQGCGKGEYYFFHGSAPVLCILVLNLNIVLLCLLHILNREETEILPPTLKRFVDQEAVNFIENICKFLVFEGIHRRLVSPYDFFMFVVSLFLFIQNCLIVQFTFLKETIRAVGNCGMRDFRSTFQNTTMLWFSDLGWPKNCCGECLGLSMLLVTTL